MPREEKKEEKNSHRYDRVGKLFPSAILMTIGAAGTNRQASIQQQNA